MAQADKLDRTQPPAGLKRKAAGQTACKKKLPLKELAAGKLAALTASDTVLKIIRRHQKGVGIPTLRAKTGFDDKKIRNIVHRAVKQGKIRRSGRGVYIHS
ncbi:MAG: hypothetical protein ABIK98_08775 [Pseudomonadota bacterium]|nr:hypothetical protein [Desulfobacterales bacterium]